MELTHRQQELLQNSELINMQDVRIDSKCRGDQSSIIIVFRYLYYEGMYYTLALAKRCDIYPKNIMESNRVLAADPGRLDMIDVISEQSYIVEFESGERGLQQFRDNLTYARVGAILPQLKERNLK